VSSAAIATSASPRPATAPITADVQSKPAEALRTITVGAMAGVKRLLPRPSARSGGAKTAEWDAIAAPPSASVRSGGVTVATWDVACELPRPSVRSGGVIAPA
jgi:hypothetical protein